MLLRKLEPFLAERYPRIDVWLILNWYRYANVALDRMEDDGEVVWNDYLAEPVSDEWRDHFRGVPS